MAIKEKISLNDQMSKTLTSITKAMKSTLAVMQQTNSGSSALGNAMKQAGKDISEAENQIKKFGNSTKESTSSIGSAITSLVSLAAIAKTVKSAMDMSDTYSQTTARVNMMNESFKDLNKTAYTTEQLQNKIYQAAQQSRGSYQALSTTVASLGNQAGDAFGSTDELLTFSETLNKLFTVSGLDSSGIESTMYNLTQSLSSGSLLGQDYRILKQNSPQMIKYIQDYYGVTRTELDDMVSDGKVSATAIKNAMLNAADDINKKYQDMPTTFSQVWTKIKNIVQKRMEPVSKVLSKVASKFEDFVDWIDNHIYVFYAVAAGLGVIAVALGTYAVAAGVAKVAQWALNKAIFSCPIFWIILLIAALVVALAYLWFTNDEVANGILTAWDWAVLGVKALWLGLQALWAGLCAVVLGAVVILMYAALGLYEAYNVLISGIEMLGVGLLGILQAVVNGVIWCVNQIINALNMIPGVSIDAVAYTTFADDALNSVLEGAAERNKNVQTILDNIGDVQDYMGSVNDKNADNMWNTATDIQNTKATQDSTREDRVKNRNNWIDSATTSIQNALNGSTLADTTSTDSTGSKAVKTTTNDDLLSDDDIQLLLDVATRDYKLNYQQITPQVTLTFGDIRETADVDGIIDNLATQLQELYDSDLEVVS